MLLNRTVVATIVRLSSLMLTGATTPHCEVALLPLWTIADHGAKHNNCSGSQTVTAHGREGYTAAVRSATMKVCWQSWKADIGESGVDTIRLRETVTSLLDLSHIFLVRRDGICF